MDKQNSIEEINEIIEFNLKNSFDILEIISKIPTLASGDEPFVIVEGIKNDKEYRFKYSYLDLFRYKNEGSINDVLLQARDLVFKDTTL